MDADYARNRDGEGGPFVTYERASDEHGRLAVAAATNRLELGDEIRLIPGHCDPTGDLHDWYAFFGGNLHRLGQADHRPARCVVGNLVRPCSFPLGRATLPPADPATFAPEGGWGVR